MKKRLWRITLLVAGIVSINAVTDSSWKNISPARDGFSILRTTFANSQRDTLTFGRNDVMAGLSFGFHAKDSVSISQIYVRRQIGTEFTTDSTQLAGATSNTAAGFQGTSANPSMSATYTVSITPLCDAFVFIVVYAGSGNGVTNPNVDYFVNAQSYSK